MKKLFVLFLCLLTVFAVVSCNNEAKKTPDSDPIEEENGGVITVRPAQGASWNSSGRFQFFLDEEISMGDTIGFLLKMSDTFSSVVVRSDDADNAWPKFATVPVNSEMLNDDGWYVINDVIANGNCYALGISAMLKSDATQNENLFVQIKNLRINDRLIDFTTCDADTYVTPFAGATAPSDLVVTIDK